MTTNLFSIFEPATSVIASMNWISIYSWVLIMPLLFWVLPNRVMKVWFNLMTYIFMEFKPLIKKKPFIIMLVLSIFLFIMNNNLTGLLPYTFTSTSHMSITLMMSLPLWVGLMAYGWLFNTSNLLTHLIPNSTPLVLMPFMVLIETISNIIRPLTLAVRLAANMVAGHLLITLLMSATPLTFFMLKPLLSVAQVSLASLEIAVALIQAYVFSVLMTLYMSESIS